jgi:hypothetical protein
MTRVEWSPAVPGSPDERLTRWTRTVPIRRGVGTPADAARFVELFNSTYARKQDPPYYFWRFWSNRVESVAFFVESQQTLRGCCGLTVVEMSGQSSFVAGFVVDLMVEARSRRTGLVFSRLKLEVEGEAARRGAKLVFLLPNARGEAAMLLDRQYVELFQIETSIRETCRNPGSLKHAVEIHEVDGFGPWVDGLNEDFQRSHPSLAFVKRTQSYLNWRFVANPTYTYKMFQATYRGNPFAYLVLKKFTDPSGATFGDIVDLIWREDDPEALSELLWFALAYFHAQGVSRATMWLRTNTILDGVGREVGFSQTDQRRPVLCKILDEQYAWLRDAERWFLTMSDSELY